MDVSDGHRPCSWYRAKYPDYHLFCVFRPFKDRLNSGYCYELSDEEIEERMSRLKCGKMYYSNDYYIDEMPDTILRFSHLDEDLNKMLNQLGFESVELLNVDIHRK